MPKSAKLKRASENELNKDIYDAGEEDDRFTEVPDPGQGMTRASQDVMQRRKIVRVSRRKFGSGSGSDAPSAPTMPASKPAASSNPFASTTLAQPTAMSTTPLASKKVVGGEPPSKLNPFANIALASNSNPVTSTAPKLNFSFGSASSAMSAPKPATSTGFSFGSNTASSSLTTSQPTAGTAPNRSLLSTPRSPKGKKEKTQQLNENLLRMVVDHWEGRMFATDYSHFLKEYQEHAENLQEEDDDGSNTIEATTETAPTVTKINSQPASSWAAPDPSPAAKPFSKGASAAPPAGTFSFASKPAADAPAAPSFSFGATPSSSAGSAPSTATTSNGNNDEPISNPDNGNVVEKVEQEENAEEEILLEVRAKHIKSENGKWKKYGAGVLRLYRHKVTSKCRMVIRNEIGKVQFNVGVSNGMKFEKVIKDTKKGKAAFVKFGAVEDASKGLESFMLQVKPDCVDKLHKTLEGMVV